MEQKTILLAGGSGFLGQSLGEALCLKGYKIRVLTRKASAQEGLLSFPCELVEWNGEQVPALALRDTWAVVNLSGAGIIDKRWSKKRREELRLSRVLSTRALVKAISEGEHKPQAFIQGSAVGFYDSRPQSVVNESSPKGEGFLADLCADWEAEARPIKSRLVYLRTGVVLDWQGGALPQLGLLYASGIGARLSRGDQWMNWIHLRDWVRFVVQAIEDSSLKGIFNLVAPDNITNATLHKSIKKFYSWSSPLSVPALSLKTLMGRKAQILLEGSRVEPRAVLNTGFKFEYPDFASACKDFFARREYPSAYVLTARQYVPLKPEEIWPFFLKKKISKS